jgi:hypothetical protein
MQKVLEQYSDHGERILRRALGRKITRAELKGLAYYIAAYDALKALIDAPTPAWVGLTFSKPRRA